MEGLGIGVLLLVGRGEGVIIATRLVGVVIAEAGVGAIEPDGIANGTYSWVLAGVSVGLATASRVTGAAVAVGKGR